MLSGKCHVIGNLHDYEFVVKAQLTFWAQNINAGEKSSSVTHMQSLIETKESTS